MPKTDRERGQTLAHQCAKVESQRAVVASRLANIEHGGDRSKTPIGVLKKDAARMLKGGT